MKPNQNLSLFGKSVRFFQHDLWNLRAGELPLPTRVGLHAVRMGTLVVSGFKRNQCSLQAASLTFFSLMALIPILALTLAMARSFGAADLAKEQLNKQLNGWMAQMEQAVEVRTATTDEAGAQAQAEVTKAFSSQVREIADKIFAQIDQLHFGTLGGIGAVMLIWTVIGVLGKVEESFNGIWGVERSRTLVRKFADYLMVILILPFLITAASTVPVAAMATKFMEGTVGGTASHAFRSLLDSALFKTSVTLATGTLTFAFLLGFMPNTRVRLVPALAGGLVTVILFVVWLKLCAMAQIGIGKYSTLYGGFAVLPILLMWVYTSWQIVLLGSEIAFAVQNFDTYMLEKNAAGASLRARVLLAIALCAETARLSRMKEGGPFAAEAFAKQRGIPHRFVMDILDDLMRSGLLAEVAGRPGEVLLCRGGDTVTVADITRVFLDAGEPPEALGLEHLAPPVLSLSQRLDRNLDDALAIPLAQL